MSWAAEQPLAQGGAETSGPGAVCDSGLEEPIRGRACDAAALPPLPLSPSRLVGVAPSGGPDADPPGSHQLQGAVPTSCPSTTRPHAGLGLRPQPQPPACAPPHPDTGHARDTGLGARREGLTHLSGQLRGHLRGQAAGQRSRGRGHMLLKAVDARLFGGLRAG